MRCTASGQARSWERDAWSDGNEDNPVICPDCGAVGPWVWVRGTDLCPRAKTRAHDAPNGITPSPYGVLRNGGRLAEK